MQDELKKLSPADVERHKREVAADFEMEFERSLREPDLEEGEGK